MEVHYTDLGGHFENKTEDFLEFYFFVDFSVLKFGGPVSQKKKLVWPKHLKNSQF